MLHFIDQFRKIYYPTQVRQRYWCMSQRSLACLTGPQSGPRNYRVQGRAYGTGGRDCGKVCSRDCLDERESFALLFEAWAHSSR
jgi:hypothetical protein